MTEQVKICVAIIQLALAEMSVVIRVAAVSSMRCRYTINGEVWPALIARIVSYMRKAGPAMEMAISENFERIPLARSDRMAGLIEKGTRDNTATALATSDSVSPLTTFHNQTVMCTAITKRVMVLRDGLLRLYVALLAAT